MAHYLLASAGAVLGLVVLVVSLDAGTFLESWFTPVLVLALLVHTWSALTRRVDCRTITIDHSSLRVEEGPLFTLNRPRQVASGELGTLSTIPARRWSPPLNFHSVHHVDAEGFPGHIMKSLPEEAEADTVRAAIVSFLART